MKPSQIIQGIASAWRALPDETLLARLAALPVLPDEDDPAWDDAVIVAIGAP